MQRHWEGKGEKGTPKGEGRRGIEGSGPSFKQSPTVDLAQGREEEEEPEIQRKGREENSRTSAALLLIFLSR